jgi:hypothetical protein
VRCLFVYGQDIPLDNIPAVDTQTNAETIREGGVSPHIFTYGKEIPLEGVIQKV